MMSDFDRAWARMNRDRVSWSVDDWKDLYLTLRAFKLRVMQRRVFGKSDESTEEQVVHRILHTRLPRRKPVTSEFKEGAK
jgi:hypothetical protein